MDNKYQLASTNIKQQQEKLSEQSNNENFSHPPPPPPVPPPKVTVSLPKHAATKLRDLVQRRDIALLRLGIISVQFEDDQIIPLTLNSSNSIQPKPQSIAPLESIIEPSIEDNNTNCMETLDTSITTLTGLNSLGDSMIEDENDLESTLNTSDSSMLDSSISVSATATRSPTMPSKLNCNTNKMAIIYDDEENDKDEDEVVNEVKNQHSSYNIHQLSQLEFADPIELEMYDNDNLLFPDYTLNLS